MARSSLRARVTLPPAALSRISTRPQRSSTVSRAALTCPGWSTSAATAWASPPCCRIASACASAASRRRPSTTTRAPVGHRHKDPRAVDVRRGVAPAPLRDVTLLAANSLDLPRGAAQHRRREKDVDGSIGHALLEKLLFDAPLAMSENDIFDSQREIVDERRNEIGLAIER